MKERNHIDRVFNEKLRNFEKVPPEDIWNSISGSLWQEKRKSLYVFTWKIAAGIALLLTTGLGWYFISGRYQTQNDLIAEKSLNEEIKAKKETLVTLPDHKEGSSEYAGDITIENKKITRSSGKILEKHMEPDAELTYPFDDEPSKLTSSITQFKTNTQLIPVYSSLLSLPEHISPPYPVNDRITRRKTKQAVTWETLTSNNVEEEKTSKEELKQWQLSAMAAPEYSYRTVKDGAMASSGYFNNSENARLSYSGGIQVGYQFSEKLNLQSGIIYSRYGTEINNLNTLGAVALAEYYNSPDMQNQKSIVNIGNSMGVIVPGNQNLTYMSYNNTNEDYLRNNQFGMENVTGGTVVLNQIDAEVIQHFDFIELPLNLRYRIYDGKINFNILGGFSSNVLVGNKVIFKSEGEKLESGRTESIRSFNYSGNLGFSLDYEISDQFMLLFEPRYKHYLRSINQEGFLDARPYMIGVFTGIRYRF